jgi:lysophospholipase L1-like esterase
MISGVTAEQFGAAKALVRQILIYGDSIVEQANTGAETSFAAVLGGLQGAEFGAVGFGGQGWVQKGIVGTPFGESWQYHFAGVKRDLGQPIPDAIYNNMGINDAGSGQSPEAVQREIFDWLTAVRQSTSYQTKIYVVVPFNLGDDGRYPGHAEAYRAGIRDYQADNPDDQQVYLVDLGRDGWEAVLNNSNDALHPNQAGCERLAQLVYAEAQRVTIEPKQPAKPERSVVHGYVHFYLSFLTPIYLEPTLAWSNF